MEQLDTNVSDIIGQECLVYSVLADLSDENKMTVATLQDNISNEFSDIVWTTPPEALHITLFAWINPLGDSSINGDELFNKNFPEYNRLLEDIFKHSSRFDVEFSELKATQDAIIMVGKDRGEFKKIRDTFVQSISLEKKPPRIIHSTIARFTKSVPVSRIDEFLKTQTVHIKEHITRFKLARETKKPMLEFEVKKYYMLPNSPLK